VENNPIWNIFSFSRRWRSSRIKIAVPIAKYSHKLVNLTNLYKMPSVLNEWALTNSELQGFIDMRTCGTSDTALVRWSEMNGCNIWFLDKQIGCFTPIVIFQIVWLHFEVMNNDYIHIVCWYLCFDLKLLHLSLKFFCCLDDCFTNYLRSFNTLKLNDYFATSTEKLGGD
jgi:hypothetical protein